MLRRVSINRRHWTVRDAFVLVFLHVKTRQVVLSPATLNPDEAWVVRQAEEFVRTARGRGFRVGPVQHDRDGKFSAEFRRALKRNHVAPVRNAVAAPMMNACVEKFQQSMQRECLDHYVILGTRHLDYLSREYLAHYHEERPHQALGNKTILRSADVYPDSDEVPLKSIRCRRRLGGLLKSYSRKAA
jgi:putative transposase